MGQQNDEANHSGVGQASLEPEPTETGGKETDPLDHLPVTSGWAALLDLSAEELASALAGVSVEDLRALRRELLKLGRHEDALVVMRELEARLKLSDAIARFEALADREAIAEQHGKPSWPPVLPDDVDRTTLSRLDMDRIAREQTAESLMVLLEGAHGSLPHAVLTRLHPALPDDRRMALLRDMQSRATGEKLKDSIRQAILLYPTANEIEQARRDAFAILSAPDVNDADFTRALLGREPSYQRSVLEPLARRNDPLPLIYSAASDLVQLLKTHGSNTGRATALSCLLGATDGLVAYLESRLPEVGYRSVEGASLWGWQSGLDALVDRRQREGRHSSDAQDAESWLQSVATARAGNVAFPSASFAEAWNFVMPVFEAFKHDAPDALITSELTSWIAAMCEAGARWEDGTRRDPMMFLRRMRTGPDDLARLVVRKLEHPYQRGHEDCKRLVVAVLKAASTQGWQPPMHPLPGGTEGTLWGGPWASAEFMKELKQLRDSPARQELKDALNEALPAVAEGAWRKELESLLSAWSK